MDCLTLSSQEGGSASSLGLLCAGEATFAFLSPGSYVLTLRRRECCLPLLVRLSPGSNVEVELDPEKGRFSWRLILFHCFYNVGR